MTDESLLYEWRTSLLSRLDQELPRDVAAPEERVRWLARHLREYVDRWVGFAEHPSVAGQPGEFAFDSGMFAVIGVVAGLIAEEVRPDVCPAAWETWREFVQLYQQMRETHDVESRGWLLRLADALLQRLDAV